MKKTYDVTNHEEIVNKDFCFVDKTSFLSQFESYKIPVFLHPRRFGQVSIGNVQKSYSNINHKDNFEKKYPAGINYWEMLGKSLIEFQNFKIMTEFKHSKKSEIKETPSIDIEQINAYKKDLIREIQEDNVAKCLIDTISH